MPYVNPLADEPSTDREDLELVRRVQAGSRDALERLVERHQPWIYNIVLRMIWHPQDAEDATQEILIKQGFIKAGYVDPHNLLFVHARLTRVRDVAGKRGEDLEALDAAYADIHREHPFHAGPDLVAALRRLLARPEFQSLVHGEEPC